jgi:hypothetical protein
VSTALRGIGKTGEGQLPDVVQALDLLRLAFGRGQHRQQEGRKNANDGNDDEQFKK